MGAFERTQGPLSDSLRWTALEAGNLALTFNPRTFKERDKC